MFNYHHVKAVEEERFDRYRHESSKRRQRHISLNQLLTALAGRLDALGIKDGKGKARPASPAY